MLLLRGNVINTLLKNRVQKHGVPFQELCVFHLFAECTDPELKTQLSEGSIFSSDFLEKEYIGGKFSQDK